MIGRLVLKSSLFGSFSSVAWLSIVIDIPDKDLKPLSTKITNEQKRNFSTTDGAKMTLYDIEMFERNRGCKLVFVDDFGKNKNYTAREWFNQRKKGKSKELEKGIMNILTYGVLNNKPSCQKGKIVTLNPEGYLNQHLKPKQF